MNSRSVALLFALLIAVAFSKVYLEESFGEGWEERWVKAEGSEGNMELARGEYYGDAEKDYGLKTVDDAKFYHWSTKMDEPYVSNEGKNLVIQYSLKNEHDLNCGGSYIKVLKSGLDQDKFDGDSDYNIMFGPDVCGSKKMIHIILNYKGENYLWKKTVGPKSDKFSHLYTLVVMADNKYHLKIDNKIVEKGDFAEDWDMIPEKEIPDPDAKKPEDWVDEEFLADPEDVKPEDWDEEPEFIADPEATQPEDWDEEFDGDWEPPMVPNPEYKGEWKPKMIKNEEYKGPWAPPMIENPDYFTDDKLYVQENMEFVGIDIWQVESGTIFDNILVTDDIEYAKEFADKVFAENVLKEQEMYKEMTEQQEASDGEESGSEESDEEDEGRDEL